MRYKRASRLSSRFNWVKPITGSPSLFPNKRCRNVCRTVPVTTVNIPERNRGLFWPLSATAVTTPVGCRFAAGQSMFTWKWISKVVWRGMHTSWPRSDARGKKRGLAIEMPFKARGVVQKILHRGLGANSGVKGLKDFFKYARFFGYWEALAVEEACSASLFGLYPRLTAIHFSCHAKTSTTQACISQTRCQSTSLAYRKGPNVRNQRYLQRAEVKE